MRGRTVLILFVLVSAAVAFIAFYERDLPSTDEREARARKLFDIEAGEVLELSFEGPHGRVRLQRLKDAGSEPDPAGIRGGWRLVDPISARADGAEVDRWLERLLATDTQRTLEDVAASELGLDPPVAELSLKTDGGDHRVEFGSRVPGSASVVARLAGNPKIFVVPDRLLDELGREPVQWRSRDLYPGDRERIDRLVIRGSAQPIELERRAEGFWLKSPTEDRADSGVVDELIEAVAGLQVSSFIDTPIAASGELLNGAGEEAGESTGLATPRWTLEVYEGADAKVFELVVGDGIGDGGRRRYARVGEQVIELESEIFEIVDRPAPEWLSRAWSGLRVFEIDLVEVEGEDLSMELRRSGSDWLRDGELVEAVRVSDFLYSITGIEADEVLSGPEAESAARGSSPELSIRLISDDGGDETLGLFVAGARGHAAQTTLRKSVLLLAPESTAELYERLRELLEAPPLSLE